MCVRERERATLSQPELSSSVYGVVQIDPGERERERKRKRVKVCVRERERVSE